MSEVKTNKISSLASNNDITLDPDGTGDVVVASGNVGIGTSSPNNLLTLQSSGSTKLNLRHTASGDDYGYIFRTTGATTNDLIVESEVNGTATERLRVGSSGNVLVGKTANNSTDVGANIRADKSFFTSDGQEALVLNRNSSDGTILEFRQANGTKGSIGTESNGDFVIDGAGNHAGIRFVSDSLTPRYAGNDYDNGIDLGKSDARFDDVFATNGTIQTSDQNEKQDIASLTTAEITAAKAISKLFKTFKWKDKVAAKGDAARTHSGVIAQEVQTAMSDAGLDASNYAFWCSDTWWEADGDTYHTADEAPDGATQRTRMGIRYAELMAFVGAATEQRLADIETRLAALEAGE